MDFKKLVKKAKSIKVSSEFINTLALAGITAIIISTFFIAIPMAEKVFPGIRYDLQTKSSYWKKTFVLDAGTYQSDADETAAIIAKRLDAYKVEDYEIQIHQSRTEINPEEPLLLEDSPDSDNIAQLGDSQADETSDESSKPEKENIESEREDEIEESQIESEESKETESETREPTQNNPAPGEAPESNYEMRYKIEVTVQSTKDPYYVQMLIMSKNEIKIMTVKDGVSFDDPENPYQKLLEDNYDETGFNNNSFRNIAIKKLINQQGDPYYFTIFKPKSGPTAESFRQFMSQTIGQEIGVSIDGFVKPYPNYMGEEDQIIMGLTDDPEEAAFYRLLLNSETLPADVAVDDIIDKKPLAMEIDYLKVTISFIVGTLASAVLIYLFTENKSAKLISALSYLLSTGFVISVGIAYLKITGQEVDLLFLVIGGLISAYVSAAFSVMNISLISLKGSSKKAGRLLFFLSASAIILITARYLGKGYIHHFAYTASLIIVSSYLASNLATLYLNNLKKYFQK
ncbi:hypothetical protein GF357_04955 [Candidatus Dojkabacteria bacterium]|nr:hypothetical protein [Candidatus Dojkabacteria bacterium]